MYPAQVFSLFPPFPREERVFVAMSFDNRFDNRWANVIAPGIKDAGLDAYRVDARQVSDSILTDILSGIANCRLVFADLTSIDGIRNGNVMYEVGLAHAVRQPQEVLLFRSDDDRLLFDITQIRVNRYNPDEAPEATRGQITQAIQDALREIDLTQNLSVQRLANSLNYWEIEAILFSHPADEKRYPEVRTVGDVISQTYRIPAITRLLQLGLIETCCPVFGPEVAAVPSNTQVSSLFTYRLTEFGRTVSKRIGERMIGRLSAEDIQRLCETEQGPAASKTDGPSPS